MEVLEESSHKHIDILHLAIAGKVTLPINEVIMQLIRSLWQPRTSVPPMAKCMEHKYHVASQRFEQFFSHPALGSVVVAMVNKKHCKKMSLIFVCHHFWMLNLRHCRPNLLRCWAITTPAVVTGSCEFSTPVKI